MTSFIPRIQHPELFLGFVAPIGADVTPGLRHFRHFLEARGYRVEEIKVTDVFKVLAEYIVPDVPLQNSPLEERYKSYIKYGNQLRRTLEDDSLLSAAAIGQIIRRRVALSRSGAENVYQKTAYLLHQFKRKEEIELLRSVYGRLFFQISIYSRRGARVDALARKFASSQNAAHPDKFRSIAEEIVQIDEEEVGEEHGQRVGKIFHDADFIITLDNATHSIEDQIDRFCEILFSSNCYSPSKIEYGMFAAKAAALRTLDLSRQVGAAIFSPEGEIICLGSNEVPKASGGTYWSDDQIDAREYRKGYDSNDRRKRQLLTELLQILGVKEDPQAVLNKREVKASQFMDALEYGRVVHAEMSAICDAARLGRAIRDGILFSTTFPCHMCAKHIVASGLKRVVFLEPYPKSLAADLHSDSLEIEGGDRGEYETYPSVHFEHFYGITPRRYRELFERSSRKTSEGDFKEYKTTEPQLFIDIKVPFYFEFEKEVLQQFLNLLKLNEQKFFNDER